MKEISGLIRGCLEKAKNLPYAKGLDTDGYYNIFLFDSIEKFIEEEGKLQKEILNQEECYATVLIPHVFIKPDIKDGIHQYTDRALASPLFFVGDISSNGSGIKMLPVSWPYNAIKSFGKARLLGEMTKSGGILKKIDLTYNAYNQELEIYNIN